MRIRALAVPTLALALLLAAPPLFAVAVGDAAPDFKLQGTDGQEVSLSQFKGKTVVLEWNNPNCPFSLRHSEEKTVANLAAKYPDVVFLAINSTSAGHKDYLQPAAYQKFNADHGVKFPVLYDASGATGKAYGAKTTPHMFVIDKSSKIAYAGAIDDAPNGGAKVNYVDQALAALAAGKPVEPASTKPYGCSVKY
jgi:peroxiredoxin